MKKQIYLLALLFIFIFSQGSPVLAKRPSTSITLKGKTLKIALRSMVLISAEGQLDDNFLSIDFGEFISNEEVKVTISNDRGEIVLDEVIYVESNTLYLYFDEDGDSFFIEVSSDKVSFYGEI